MQATNIVQLNKKFSLDDGANSLRFMIGEGGLPVIEVKNYRASARISLQGAHVLSWKPVDREEVIWMSDAAVFAPGRSIRGGIPICWPWFGAHESHSDYPAHGFARTVLWQVIDTQQYSASETRILFKIDTSQLDEKMQQMWPTKTVLHYRLTISNTLKLELITFNQGEESICIGQALHTYFRVNDVSQTTVHGLDDKTYLDKTDDFSRKTQTGPVEIRDEVDRVYLDTADDVAIDDGARKIVIKKLGSLSTVIWNPWKQVAKKMGDLGDAGYMSMLCVESANAFDDVIEIQPGQSHLLKVTYGIEEINR